MTEHPRSSSPRSTDPCMRGSRTARCMPGFRCTSIRRIRGDTPGPHDQYNRTKPAIVSSAALGDLDGDGKLEVVVAAADRHVYAWHADGSPVDGFPVLVVDPTTVQSVDPVTHSVTFASGSGAAEGGELIATPRSATSTATGIPTSSWAHRRSTPRRRTSVTARTCCNSSPRPGRAAATLGSTRSRRKARSCTNRIRIPRNPTAARSCPAGR